MKWLAQAPSNIALIKYMGKKDPEKNIPTHASFSYTLPMLTSTVELESVSAHKDFWEPLYTPAALPFALSEAAQIRFLDHLQFLKQYFGFSGTFIVRSCNNFPHSVGIASSASSFAALTRCASRAISALTGSPEPSTETLASLSRQGSGSSCRSFFSPWALWREETVEAIDLPYSELLHSVIIITHAEKAISSSEAHARVLTSPGYQGRAERAEQNLHQLLNALQNKDWAQAYEVTWKEFWDLHQLFETADLPFSYMNDTCKTVLYQLQKLWKQEGDGPLVTMDAGSSIHLLYRLDQAESALKFKQEFLQANYDVL